MLRDNLDATRRPSEVIIDVGHRFGKALIDAERQSVFRLLCDAVDRRLFRILPVDHMRNVPPGTAGDAVSI